MAGWWSGKEMWCWFADRILIYQKGCTRQDTAFLIIGACSSLFFHRDAHDFIIHLLTLVGECIVTDFKLRQEVDQGVDAAFCLKKFVDNDHFFRLQDAVSALKSASFIPDHIAAFFRYPLNLVQVVLCVFHRFVGLVQFPGTRSVRNLL